MQDKSVQGIRYKLQKRVRRLLSADHHHFAILFRVFVGFFDRIPLLAGIRDEMLASEEAQGLQDAWDRVIGGQPVLGETDRESAILGYLILKQLAETPHDPKILFQLGRAYGASGKTQDHLDMVR